MGKPGVNEAAQYFESIFTVAHEGIIFVDQEGIILRVNPAFTKILGYEEHELQGKSFFTLAYRNPKMIQITSHHPLRRFYQSEKDNMEITLLDKEGHFVPVRFRAALIRDEQNQIKQAIGVIEHMVELTGTDEAGGGLAEKMWEAQQNFDNVLNNSADAILICEITGNIMTVNKAFLQMLDYTQEEVIGKHIAEFTAVVEGTFVTITGDEIIIDREYINNTGQKSVELFEKGYVKNWETHLVRKDKVIVPIEATLSVLKDKYGDRRGSVVIARDITERKKTEKEIKESRDFLEKIIEDIADGIIICDLSGAIITTNNALEGMTGLRKEELIGKHSSRLIKEDKEIRKRFLKRVEELFKKGHTSYETVIENRDGTHVEVDCNCSLLKDEKGEYLVGVSVLRDITERKEMEHKLLQSEKLKSLGELAGGVAHDFNNVLAAILGRAQLLKMIVDSPPRKKERRKLVPELKKSLEVIEKASLDGAETVRRIQEFARRRDEDKCFTTIDLNEIIEDALEFTKVRWKNDAESKGIKITIQKEFSTLPTISGSASELREVFTNLINNAIDAMPQGGRIKIKTFKNDDYLFIKIKDAGIGIADDRKERIFDPFSTTKGVKSSGLGLSVSYGIINRHRGTITVDSVEREGTTFSITLPIYEEEIEEQVKLISDEQRKAKILVIEDESEVCELLKDILTDKGHNVETTSNGSQGVELFKGNRFDLVFTDLGMPSMTGWQVAEEIKKIDRKVPVALITGWDVHLKDYELKEKGVDFVVTKPFQVDQVLRLVQEGMILRDRFKAA